MNPWTLNPCIQLAAGGIGRTEAERQQRTAGAILERLSTQPGIILADEVGMGKTFVALAVLASAAWASEKPAVVMAPPRLIEKWKRDATRFKEHCIAAGTGGEKQRFECRTAETGAAFLKCFDDPPERACQLVLLANTALHRNERDPWVRLAAMRLALARTSNPERTLRVVARFARNLLPNSELSGLEEEHFARILSTEVDRWRSYLESVGVVLEDDPVPMPFMHALTEKLVSGIAAALEHVPIRVTESFDERIKVARGEVSTVLKAAWKAALHHAQIHSPLLVFDEAHHLKNADTRLAQLFQAPETADTSVISGAFERMVFLTATPFQLGHSELVEVLRRFRAIRWEGLRDSESPESFAAKLDALQEKLTAAQLEALTLDRLWGQLRETGFELDEAGELTAQAQGSIFDCSDELSDAGAVASQYKKVQAEFARAQALLRPWVVRHLRDRHMTTEAGPVPRRRTATGRGIKDGSANTRGLDVAGAARFPFLLCARAQGVLAHHSGRRAYFAEGLASSYGAFKDTVGSRARPTDDADVGLEATDPLGHVDWYVREVRRTSAIAASRSSAGRPSRVDHAG